MNIKLILTLGLILSLFFIKTSNAQSKSDCMKLHQGKFTYGPSENPNLVEIKGNKHIEYHSNKKYYIKSKLIWVNDCEYNMTIKKNTDPSLPIGKGATMNVKINKVEGNKIYYLSTFNNFTYNGVYTKIE